MIWPNSRVSVRCSKVVSAPSQSRHKGGNIRIPVGRHLRKFIPLPEDFITNNAFGGPDIKTLYVSAGKTLYKVRRDIAGLPR
jgi:sugar lactone lactonase YvrE